MPRAGLAVLLTSLVAGCGLFVDVDGLSGDEAKADAEVDAAAPSADAGAPSNDAGATTDAATDGGAPFCRPADLFCETFDQGRFDPRWTVPPGAELVQEASSPPYAAKLAPTSDVNMFLRLVLAPPAGNPTFRGVLDIELAFRTVSTGVLVGQVTLERGNGGGNFQLFTNTNDVTMGINLGGSSSMTAKKAGTSFERVRISATTSPDGSPQPLSFNDRPTAPNTIPWVVLEPSKLTLDIGFVAPPGGANAVILIDDVRVALRAP